MKRLPLLTLASLLFASINAPAMASRNSTPAITPEQLANAPEAGQLIQGGAQAGNGLWAGPVMQSAVSGRVVNAQAELVAAISFGEDVAPDAPVIDTAAIEGKNNLDAAIKALSASKNPQAAAAAAMAGPALKALETAMKPVPQGDRKGAQGIFLMRGDSDDVRNYGESLNESIAAIRLKQQPRANVSETTTRTEKIEYTDSAVSNLTDTAEAWIAADLEKERMEQDREGKITAAKMEEEDKAAAAVGAPLPARTAPSSAAAYVAETYPGLRLGGGNDGPASQSSLWKPASDSDGNLVVVLPHSAMGKIESMTVGGDTVRPSSIGNGFRPNLRFPRPGAAYTGPFSIKAESGTWTGTSPGGKRTEPLPMTKTAAAIPVSEMPKPEVPAGQGE